MLLSQTRNIIAVLPCRKALRKLAPLSRFSMKRYALYKTIPVFALLQALFVAAYLSREHTFHFWDYVMYYDMARAQYASFQVGWVQGFEVFRRSLEQSYNHIFALPSLFAFALFGVGRKIFILTNFTVFFLAYEVAIAFVLRRLFNLSWLHALLAGFAACSFIPPLWVPLLKGYPDIGAAACLVFAVGINLSFSGEMRKALLTGVLLGCAVLLRRHFAYPAATFLVVLFVSNFLFVLLGSKPPQKLALFVKPAVYFVICCVVAAATIFVVAPDFFIKAATVNYGDLYSSYRRPMGFFASFVLQEFGALLLLLAFCGFIYSFNKHKLLRFHFVFILLLTVVWFFVWSLGPSQAGNHYLLHVLPLFVCIGLMGLWSALPFPLSRRGFISACLLVLAFSGNSAWSLWLSPVFIPSSEPPAPGILSASHSPEIRGDYEELKRLAEYLAETTIAQDKIFVLGSSFVFNQDLMRVVYFDALQRPDLWLRFVYGPEADSGSVLPLSAFASANIYVVPEPAQYHLAPEKQKVITATARQFPPPKELADYFSRDYTVFLLQNGVKINIWRRKPWSPGALHEALKNIRKESPSFQQFWIEISGLQESSIVSQENGKTDFFAFFNNAGSAELFFDAPLHSGDYRLEFTTEYSNRCVGEKFTLSVLTQEGEVLSENRFYSSPLSPLIYRIVSVPEKPGFAFVKFGLNNNGTSACVFAVRGLSIEKII